MPCTHVTAFGLSLIHICHLSCNFRKGKINGTFTAILMGGGDSTSLECTLDVDGLGLFTKPQKLLDERLEMLRKALGV